MKNVVLSVFLLCSILMLSSCADEKPSANVNNVKNQSTNAQTESQTEQESSKEDERKPKPESKPKEEEAIIEPAPIEEEETILGPVEIPDYKPPSPGDRRYMSNGRYCLEDPDTGLYGYIDRTGKFVIPAIYERAEDFSDGCAIALRSFLDPETNKNKHYFGVIDTSGKIIVPFQYQDIESNGLFLMANTDAGGTDFYRFTGQKLTSIDVQLSNYSKSDHKYQEISYAQKNPLIALKEGNKWALAQSNGMLLTEALYDSIILDDDSNFAILKYGDQFSLASVNGVIVELGQYRFCRGGNDYTFVTKRENDIYYTAFVNTSGVCSEFIEGDALSYLINGTSIADFHKSEHMIIAEASDRCYIYDTTSGILSSGSVKQPPYFISLDDGTQMLFDGTPCTSAKHITTKVEEAYGKNEYSLFTGLNGKYGLAYDGMTQVGSL